jgi:glycerol-3-phosphate dehydrogenase (NAD(P)+)
MRISILGAGAWGTALAINFSKRHPVNLWVRDYLQFSEIETSKRNPYLPDFLLREEIKLFNDIDAALKNAQLIILAVPTSGLRETLQSIKNTKTPVIWVCKGFETNTAKLPHQVITEELSGISFGVLSGPSFAQEVAQEMPTAITLAANDEEFAQAMAEQLHDPRFRIYSSTDIVGVEVSGAVKNVIAIAAGISDGMGFGYNSRAALITRGLAEVTRLGLKMGGQAQTFMGLAGLGDLILTCTGNLSRNRKVGLMLAQNKTLPTILKELGHVAEGVGSTREVYNLAQKLNVEMPIVSAVYQVLYENLTPDKAVELLLDREIKPENKG